MSPLDVIPIPGHPGMYARRIVVEAWQEAGSPPINSAGRLHALQKYFYDGWREGRPGFNPADNPDDETQRLAHVRFVALDIDPTPSRVQKLSAAGLYRPYTYELWHWEVPNVRKYDIVRALPTTGATASAPTEEEETMYIANIKNGNFYLVIGTKAHALGAGSAARQSGIPIINYPDDWDVKQLKTVVSGIK